MSTPAVLLVLVTSSCAPPSAALGEHAAASGAPKGSGPLLSGSVQVTDAYDVHASFTSHMSTSYNSGAGLPVPLTCAGYANGELLVPSDPSSRMFVAPIVQTAGGTNVYITATVSHEFSGPGNYDSRTLTGVSGRAVVEFSGDYDFFRPRLESETTLVVRSDGSGTLTIADWYSIITDSYISGKVAWRCGD